MTSPVVAEHRKTRQTDNLCYSGFPARNLIKRTENEGYGEWITAYQAEQKRHLKATVVPSKPKERRTSQAIYPPANTRETSGFSSILNKRFLTKTCCVEVPEHLRVANIRGYKLLEHNSTFFHEFVNLVSIDASDNQLTLDSFESFPVLESLNLSVNIIRDVTYMSGSFSHLRTLNLSYNSINTEALVALGCLPYLTTLYLTGNSLVTLPPEMATPFQMDGSQRVEMRFPELRTLNLDDNKLCDVHIFAVLAGLRQLEELNLSNNQLTSIPQLKVLGTGLSIPPVQPSQSNNTSIDNHAPTPFTAVSTPTSKPHPQLSRAGVKAVKHVKFPSSARLSQSPGRANSFSERLTISPLDRHYNTPRYIASARGRPGSTSLDEQDSYLTHARAKSSEKVKPTLSVSNINPALSSEITAEELSLPNDATHELIHLPATTSTEVESRSQTMEGEWSSTANTTTEHVVELANMAPFPKLKTLNMSSNFMYDSEDVLGCHGWPSLETVIIINNPLVGTHKGLPRVLQEELVCTRGIQVIRHKPKAEKHKYYIREKVKSLKKISSSPPSAVPKYPLLPAIEAKPIDSAPSSRPERPSLGFPESEHNSSGYDYYGYGQQQSLGSESEAGSSMDSLGVFMTQVASHQEASESTKQLGTHSPTGDIVPPSAQQEQKEAWSPGEAYQARLRELEERFKDVEDKYKGYELLLDDRGTDADVHVPTDILSCCKSLHHLLRRPVLLPHYTTTTTTTTSHSTVPHLKAGDGSRLLDKKMGDPSCHGSIPRQEVILEELKRQSVNNEVGVADILASKDNSKTTRLLRKECKKLLAEMQKHYDDVKANAFK